MTLVKHRNGLAGQNGAGKFKVRHVGSAPRTVYGKEAQPGGGDIKQMTVGMGHQFVGFFGGGI